MKVKKQKLALFGGTGGLGKQLINYLEGYEVVSIGSKSVDVTNFKETQEFFNNNNIDIVINLSGYNYNSPIHKYNENNIDEVTKQTDVVIKGNMNILSSCLPQMREKGYGRIILASSVLSSKPVFGTAVYAGCKAFVDNVVKSVTIENLSKGITCNSLQLGYMDGGILYDIPDAIRTNIKDSIPLKRWGTIEEITNAIKYFINTEYTSGHTLKINGGLD
jgi:NAD(P)-dependent dehydrogenase (short-subunit alcohol dehydrogenase family)